MIRSTKEDRDKITRVVKRVVKVKTGVVMDDVTARLLIEAVVELYFKTVIETGYVRLPGGWGSLHLRELKPTRKRLPTGTMLKVTGDRAIIRYVEGLAARELLGKLDKYPGRLKERRSALDELYLHLGEEITTDEV